MNASRSRNRWEIGLAPRALKEVKKFKRDRNSFEIVWKKIRELSSGQFTPDNHKVIIGTPPHIPIYRARLSNDLRIIYHVDVVPDKAKEFDHQVIKILRIDARARIDYGFWPRVSAYLYRKYRSSEYRERCIFQLPKSSSENNVYFPAKFPHVEHASDGSPVSGVEERGEDEVLIELGSGRFVAATKSLHDSIVGSENSDGEAQEPEVEPKAPVKTFHPMGRINLPPDPDPYQYEIIRHQGATIVVGRSGTGKTTALIYKMQSIQASTVKPIRQLFVTRSPVLARHVESSFGRLADSANMEAEGATEPKLGETPKDLDQALVEFDNEVDLRDDLPLRFSLLEDSHFPLFISFEKLCSLIEEDIYEEEGRKKQYFWSAKPMCQREMIGYKEFKEIYWPQFKSSDRFGLNPFLAYSEIVGVIKGYSEVLKCAHGYLSQDEYIWGSTAHKVSAHLDASVKAQIYSMFEDYRRIKGTRFELDQADRSHHVLQSFPQKTLGDRASVDFLYVDEVQDNLMTDIRLLRRLCRSVDGTYWGGDTAQTILAGSAFRIKDLGSYIYTEAHDDIEHNRCRLPSNSALSKFELTVNYRSQAGIVDCAASIIESLYRLFPESLDRLARETAADGSTESLPVVLTNTGPDASLFEKFLLQSTSSLGAQQAILVRSEELAEQLSSRISEFCPILTISNSKGLEFDDILLYNFFAESESPSAWEFVHGISAKAHRNARDSVPPLSLCNELKLLYVAMTRARQRCWIWDHGPVIDAMKQFWSLQGLITTTSVSTMIDWGSTSDSAQWIRKGQEYFANGMYKLAAGCFKRGGTEAETSHRIAMAYYGMSRAKLEMRRNDTRDSREGLRVAAAELGNCAGRAQGQSARHLWFHAAICLELAHDTLLSVDAFVNAGLYERAIRILLDQDYVNRGVRIFLKHGDNLEPRVREGFLDHFRQYYFKKHDFQALPQLFDGNLDDILLYARKRAFWDQLKYLLEYHGRFDELAQVHLEERALVKGLDSFLTAYNHHHKVSSLNNGATVTINYAEWVFALGSHRSQRALDQLVVMIEKVLPYGAKLERRRRKDLELFHTIVAGRLKPGMMKEWDQKDPEERLRKALILHELIQDMGWLNSRELGTLIPRLNTWGNYATILSKIAEASEPSNLAAARRLFGFRPPSSGLYTTSYIVADGSWIAKSAPKYTSTAQQNKHKELMIPARWIDKILKDEFRGYLHDRFQQIYSGLIRSGLTSLHLFKPHARTPQISRPISRATTSDNGFKTRLSVANFAIQAFAPICHVPLSDTSSRTNPSLIHRWARHLFNIIYPMTGVFEEFTPVARGQPGYPGIRTCIRQYLVETSSVDLSTFVIVDSLIAQLVAHDPSIHSILHTPPDVFPENRLLEKYMVDAFFNWKETNGLTVVNDGLREILQSSEEPLDVAVLVHLVEAITCELLFHARAAHSTSQNVFSGLILPYSWARLLSKRYARSQIVRDTSSMETFLEVVIMISDGLKYDSHDRWWIGEELLAKKRDLAHILQLRLCWCISLLLVNSPIPLGFSDGLTSSLIHIAGDPYERMRGPLYRRFNSVINRESCLEALCETFNHETLVALSYKSQKQIPWQARSDILVVRFTESGNLPNSLQKSLRL